MALSDITLRKLEKEDAAFHQEMVYESAYVPNGKCPFPRSILADPSVSRFFEEWGVRHGDIGLVAVQGNREVGAVWLRKFVDTPEFGIAVCKNFRGNGIGRHLLKVLESEAIAFGYERLTLSVDPRNPAIALYERTGYSFTGWDHTFWKMEKLL